MRNQENKIEVDIVLPLLGLMGTGPFGGLWHLHCYAAGEYYGGEEDELTFSDGYFEGFIYYYVRIK